MRTCEWHCEESVPSHQDIRFWKIFWVDATNSETISLSYRDIAYGPDAQSSRVEDSVESVLRWISTISRQNNCLLVFDNADCGPDVLLKYMPRGNWGNILITSRNPNMRLNISPDAWVEVQEMEEEDAISLLMKTACLDTSSQELKQVSGLIVARLCHLPLAVDQAGAAIASGLCDINGYLKMYSDCRLSLMDHPSFKGASEYGRAVYATWDVSFATLEVQATEENHQSAHAAITVLKIFAFLHHENIGEEIFLRAAEASGSGSVDGESNYLDDQLLKLNKEGQWDPMTFKEGIQVLLGLSLVKKGESGRVYFVHPLVHAWSRDRMAPEEQKLKCSSARGLLSKSITFEMASEDYAFRRTLLAHIQANCQHGTEVGIGKNYDGYEYTKFALVQYEAGYWKEAEELQVQVMETRKRTFGAEHPDTLTSMNNLASTYMNQGRLKDAEELQVQVMETRNRMFGAEHPDTLTSMGNLASTYRNQGKWKDAEELEVQVMETRKRILGTEHPDTLTSMSNLASTYWNQGRLKDAEELEVQVMKTRKRILGAEHPDTLTSMSHLASTYRKQERWKDAEELEAQVMETSLRMLGAEHPDTLTSMSNLASTYWNQGRWKDAEELQVQVMETNLRMLGAEHPSTLTSMSNLASTYRNQGRWKDAEELQVQVMEASLRMLGSEHPDTLTSMSNLASTYRNQGRWKDAEELQVQVMETSLRMLGAEHPDTLTSMSNLAATYMNQGRWKDAEELEVKGMETSLRMLGAEHPDTLASMNNLAATYKNQGRWKDAEKLQVQVMETSLRTLGAEHPDTLTSMSNLASTYKNQGRWKDAEKLQVQVMETSLRTLGAEHPDTLTSMRSLASTYWNQKRSKDAVSAPYISK